MTDEINILPSDMEVLAWYTDNIDSETSASSAIYKFRLWLKERQKKLGKYCENCGQPDFMVPIGDDGKNCILCQGE